MAFNPMQQQQSPDMLMAMMTDPRATPQQRMAAMSALNTMRGGANAPQPPQMTGDGTGVSDMDPAFMAAVRQEMMGQGPEEQPEIPQRQAAPEAPQNPATAALMSGAADASRVAAMAQGGAVKGYADGEEVEPTTAQRLATAYNEEIDFPDLYEKLKQKVKASNKGIYNFLHGEGSYDAVDKRSYASRNVSPSSEKRIEDKILREITAKRMAGIDPNAELPAIPPGAPGYGGFNGPVENASPEIEMPQVNTPQFNIAPRAKAAAAAAKALTAPPPAAVEPGKPDPAAKAINARKQAESDAYKERMDRLLGDKQPLSSQDKYMALLQASLGTMAAASQPGGTFLGSIGQGGLLGVKQLQEAKAARAERNMKQATLLQSQRSEDLSNEARDRQLKVSERGVEIQGARELREAEAEILAAPTRKALIEAQTANLIRPEKVSPLEQEINIQNKIDAMPDGKDKTRAQVVFDQSRTREVPQTSSFVIQQAIINAGEEAGKAFDKTLTVLEQVETDPVKKAETANKRQAAVEEAERRAAVRFNVSNSSTAAPSPAAGGGWSATEVK
jgi:hypothetical protein